MGGLLRSALFAMKRLTIADTTEKLRRRPHRQQRADAARSWGVQQNFVRNPAAQLVWRHQLKILCVECPLEPEASEPMLHCNGNKQAGPSFPE